MISPSLATFVCLLVCLGQLADSNPYNHRQHSFSSRSNSGPNGNSYSGASYHSLGIQAAASHQQPQQSNFKKKPQKIKFRNNSLILNSKLKVAVITNNSGGKDLNHLLVRPQLKTEVYLLAPELSTHPELTLVRWFPVAAEGNVSEPQLIPLRQRP
jgi:hypothetical protein